MTESIRQPCAWRRRPRGQALVEFAILLPLLAALTGGVIDFARVYQASITLQSATRNAAESAATATTSSSAATTEARRVVCTETQHLPGFVPGAGNSVPNCTAPAVTLTAYSFSTSAPGSTKYPLVKATVHAQLDFDLLIPWPFISGGHWTLRTTQSYDVIQGR